MQQLPDLSLLHMFLTVIEHQSMSQAALSLNLTQPAITKKIKRLESLLEAEAFVSVAQLNSITKAGEMLIDRAPSLLRNARALTADIRSLTTSNLPTLRIGMSDSLSEILGAEFVGAMQSFATTVELKSGISPWLETAFRARHFDLAVDNPPFADTAQIDLKSLFKDPLVIAMPKSFAGRDLAEILQTENYVGYGRTSKMGALIIEQLARIGVYKPTRFHFDSTQSLLRFVQAGYGWAITSAFCLLQSPNALRDLAFVPCPNSTPREFFLLNRAGEHEEIATAAHEKFTEIFQKMSNGPWEQIDPKTAQMIRAANS